MDLCLQHFNLTALLKYHPVVLYKIMVRSLKNVQFCSRSRQAKILTTVIHRVFRGLKFEPNAEIGRKGTFFKDLKVYPLYPDKKYHQGF